MSLHETLLSHPRSPGFVRRDRVRIVVLSVVLAIVCLVLGAMVARGGIAQKSALGIVVVAALVLPIASLRLGLLLSWAPLTVVLLPFARFPHHQPLVTFDRLWILGGGVLLMLITRSQRRYTASVRLLFGALLAFTLYYGLRTAISGSAGLHALGLWVDAIVTPSVLCALAFRFVRSEDDCRRIAVSFAVAGAYLGSLAIVQRVTGLEFATLVGSSVFLDPTVGFRVSGPLPSPDELAMCLVMCFAMTLYLIHLRWHSRTLLLVVCVIEIVGLTFTFFRGAWISAILVLIVAAGLRPRRYGRLLAVASLVLAIAGAVLLESYATIGQRIGDAGTISQRLATYKASFSLVQHSPVFGIGVSGFTAAASENLVTATSTTVGGETALPYAHNSFLLILAEQGAAGLLLFVFLAYASGRVSHRFIRRAGTDRVGGDYYFGLALIGCLLTYFIMSMELAELTNATSNAFLGLLLGCAASRYDQLQCRDPRPADAGQVTPVVAKTLQSM